ncbi:MAG: hypothetical protein AAFX65_13590, partial [Cyanobacteria bacterium J06638_7]
ELIAVARVDVEWFKVCRQIRDAIEAVPSRVIDRIVGHLTGVNREEKAWIRSMLQEEIRITLEQLSRGIAGGAA